MHQNQLKCQFSLPEPSHPVQFTEAGKGAWGWLERTGPQSNTRRSAQPTLTYFQRKSDRNVGCARCIFLGAASDKSNIFETREEVRQVEPQTEEDGKGIFSQEVLCFPLVFCLCGCEGIENASRKSFYYFIFTHSMTLFFTGAVITIIISLGILRFYYSSPKYSPLASSTPQASRGQSCGSFSTHTRL